MKIAVVGSGVASLTCTRALAALARDSSSSLAGSTITYFTRRSKMATQMGPRNQTKPSPGEPFWDYAVQYFTSGDEWFRDEVHRWARLGLCQALPDGAVGTVCNGEFTSIHGGECWVGNGGMGVLMAKLIEQTSDEFVDCVVHVCGFPNEANGVVKISKLNDGWWLGTKDGRWLGPFDLVVGAFAQHVLTDPFLLSGGEPCKPMLRCIRKVESNQLFPLQLMCDPLPVEFSFAHVQDEPSLSFCSNNSKKPQQSGKWGTEGAEHWTLVSTSKFAERQFNEGRGGYRAKAEKEMLAAFARAARIDLACYNPHVNRINHWEDAVPVKTPPKSKGCLLDMANGLAWCGDFCVAPNVEGAAISGRTVARTIAAWVAGEKGLQADLLPEGAWVAFSSDTNVHADIAMFHHPGNDLELKTTHTCIVPGSADGYFDTKHHRSAGLYDEGKASKGIDFPKSFDGKGMQAKGKGKSKGTHCGNDGGEDAAKFRRRWVSGGGRGGQRQK